MPDDRDLLHRIDVYLDAVPRAAARVESIGPFSLFVNEGPGWRYYARPTPGATSFTRADVDVLRKRQRAIDQPESIEWIVELTPGVGPAATKAGLRVVEHPLMYLQGGAFRPTPVPARAAVSIAEPRDDLAKLTAVAAIAFGSPGTDVGPDDREAFEKAADEIAPGRLAFVRDRMERGLTITAVAWVDGAPVAVGSHQPVDGVTEIVGVGCLPAFRRRGLGAAVTAALVDEAQQRGVQTVFLSAGDQQVARVYGGLGFRPIGAAGSADPPSGNG
jgi:ribosomal protein S18 acetylase RimI-like enzyme